MKTHFRNQNGRRRGAFTLIELLVVISIIAVLTALLIPVMGGVFRAKKISTAKAEMAVIESALENYKAKYGVYPPCNPTNALINQLYFELGGVTSSETAGAITYNTLDGLYSAPAKVFADIFAGAGGVVNCSKGSGEDAVVAKNFLLNFKSTQFAAATNYTQDGNFLVPYLVTSVGGSDDSYHPASFGNPFRYIYPGVNNPNSYDLWVNLSIGSTPASPKIYLVCNWSSQVQLNSALK
ncbi:MAG TPA: type II secretion system protein [Verrucomicrobiae bacterium]|jgi:prepilin-type N-terminal cleavage/methylation domain-containing protein